MANGKKADVTIELTQEEKNFLIFQHGAHIKCEVGKCTIHTMVHMIIRLEAGRRKMEHEAIVVRGTENNGREHGICERCDWTPGQWVESLGNEWGRDG